MAGRKGIVHYRLKTRQETMGLVLEEYQSYAEVVHRLGIRKSEKSKFRYIPSPE